MQTHFFTYRLTLGENRLLALESRSPAETPEEPVTTESLADTLKNIDQKLEAGVTGGKTIANLVEEAAKEGGETLQKNMNVLVRLMQYKDEIVGDDAEHVTETNIKVTKEEEQLMEKLDSMRNIDALIDLAGKLGISITPEAKKHAKEQREARWEAKTVEETQEEESEKRDKSLLARALDENRDISDRLSALGKMERLPKEAIAAVERASKKEDADVRDAAKRTLGNLSRREEERQTAENLARETALNTSIDDCDFQETPLVDVAEFFSDKMTGFKVELDEATLEECLIDTDIPITFQRDTITIQDALDGICNSEQGLEVGFMWKQEGNKIVITVTPEEKLAMEEWKLGEAKAKKLIANIENETDHFKPSSSSAYVLSSVVTRGLSDAIHARLEELTGSEYPRLRVDQSGGKITKITVQGHDKDKYAPEDYTKEMKGVIARFLDKPFSADNLNKLEAEMAEALKSIGEDEKPGAITATKDVLPDEDVRDAAQEALGNIKRRKEESVQKRAGKPMKRAAGKRPPEKKERVGKKNVWELELGKQYVINVGNKQVQLGSGVHARIFTPGDRGAYVSENFSMSRRGGSFYIKLSNPNFYGREFIIGDESYIVQKPGTESKE